jgi:hypothetical protein
MALSSYTELPLVPRIEGPEVLCYNKIFKKISLRHVHSKNNFTLPVVFQFSV